MTKEKRSLQEVVGESTYAVWIDILRRLVPSGRTHRIAPVVAAMLQHAAIVAEEQLEGEPEENSVAQSLLYASELYDVDGVSSEIGDITERLFTDAGVAFKRTNVRGEHYSIVEAIWHEFLHWYDMPWES